MIGRLPFEDGGGATKELFFWLVERNKGTKDDPANNRLVRACDEFVALIHDRCPYNNYASIGDLVKWRPGMVRPHGRNQVLS